MSKTGKSKRQELKKNMLKRAWRGISNYSVEEMLYLIKTHTDNAQIPKEHEMILAGIEHNEPRAVRMLNLHEKHKGNVRRHTADPEKSEKYPYQGEPGQLPEPSVPEPPTIH